MSPPPETPTPTTTPTPASNPAPKARRHWSSYIVTKRALIRCAVLIGALLIVASSLIWYGASMPGTSFRGPLPAASEAQRALAVKLRTHVEKLAGELGGRSTFEGRKMARAASYLRDELLAMGYAAVNETFAERGSRVPNLEVVLLGTQPQLPCIVVGAHYDAYQGTPGADDNASGSAAVLEIARALSAVGPGKLTRTVRIALFINEEPPAFQTADMGSWIYAKALKAAGVQVHSMISVEAIGYYRSEPNTQKYPLAPLARIYPNTGDFIAFVGDVGSRWLVREAIGTFREKAQFPSEGAALPGQIAGVGWSDHWSFWQEGFSAIMVTGTATFRNPNYHLPSDRPDTLDYDRMSRVTEGLVAVTRSLADK